MQIYLNPELTHIKCYDAPKTPFQRMLNLRFISTPIKYKLNEQFKNLNPFRLRKAMNQKLNKIFVVQSKKIGSCQQVFNSFIFS